MAGGKSRRLRFLVFCHKGVELRAGADSDPITHGQSVLTDTASPGLMLPVLPS